MIVINVKVIGIIKNMSSTKEKANELVEKFRPHAQYWDNYHDVPLEEDHAVQCAIIAVEEVIDNILGFDPSIDYWMDVKHQLEEML